MLKNRVIYVLILLLLVLFRIAYTGYVAGMLLVIALLLPIFSWLISLPGALCTRISLSVPDQITRGSEASITLTMRQSRLFSTGPAAGKLRTENTITGEVSDIRLRSAQGSFPLNTEHCCVFRCSFRRFRVTDLMGLFPVPTRRPGSVSITVLPIPVEPREHPDWSSASTVVPRPFSGGENPYDLRDYRAGDTLKAIHWKKSAALDKTVVRETLEPAVRIAGVWIDWMEDAGSRDEALDQLAWCVIYLKQNNAGLLLRWQDSSGEIREIYAPQGGLDDVVPQILCQRAGKRTDPANLRGREILLAAGSRGGTAP